MYSSAFKYLKNPVGSIIELYQRYPDGGELGWYAYCVDINTFVVWDVTLRIWKPMSNASIDGKVDKEDIAQVTGDDPSKVLSQAAATMKYGEKEDVSNKKQIINDSETEYPSSKAVKNALAGKVSSHSPAFTGNPTGLTKASVGLSNVNNTSDENKPISILTQVQLDNRIPKTAIKSVPGPSQTDLMSQKAVLDYGNTKLSILPQTLTEAQKLQVRNNADLQSKLVFNVKDFGAKGDGITDDTAAIQAAYDATKNTDPFFFAEKGVLYFPTGTYLNTGILISTNIKIFGDGMATRLVNTSTSSNLITIEGGINSVGIIEISDLRLSGTGTGSIININKYIKTIIRNIHIYGSGGYGISFGETEHVGVIDIVNCRILLCQNSAIYGRSKDTAQVNAINIENTYISYNQSHGVDVFGAVLNILNSTIEANQGIGINVDSSNFATESYRISNINIDKNYIENNKGGNISIVGGKYSGNIVKLIRHLNISNNYIYSGVLNIDGSTPTNKNVSFSRRGDNTDINFYLNDVINTMTWKNNNVFNANPLLDIIDFDNALSDTCIIWMDGLDAYNWIAATVEDPRKPKYINLGRAKFISTQTLILSGTSLAKSSEITYSSVSARKSDAITTNEVYKYVEFPIPLPSNSIITDITIPVYVTETDKAFDLTIDLYSASILSDVNTLKNHILRSGKTHNSLTTPYISRSYFPEETAYNVVGADIDLLRSGYGKEEWFIKVGIKSTIFGSDSIFYLGNPIIKIN